MSYQVMLETNGENWWEEKKDEKRTPFSPFPGEVMLDPRKPRANLSAVKAELP